MEAYYRSFSSQRKSVNDGIPKHLCSISYISVDEAIQKIVSLGRGTLLAKIDIRSAFRLIPMHPADCHLLAMEWRGATYIDTCRPFSLRSAPKLFNVLADLLEWILLHLGVSVLLHYLDDYLTMGPPNTQICHQNLRLLTEVCAMLGIPLALEKVEGSSTILEFLGILLDTTRMEARLPPEKTCQNSSNNSGMASQKEHYKERHPLPGGPTACRQSGTPRLHIRQPHV